MNLDTLVEAKRVGEEVIPVVDLRGLHKLLEVKRKFADWAKDKVKHYKEGKDFCILSFNNPTIDKNGKKKAPTSKEYYVSLEIAKSVVKDKPALVEFFEEKQQKLEPEKYSKEDPSGHPVEEPTGLISVKEGEIGGKKVQTVSAKELYKTLGLDITNWSRWSKQNIKDNPFAVEGEDYALPDPLVSETNGKGSKDYTLSLPFAKKIAMTVKTYAGEMVRNYFLECEAKLQKKEEEFSAKDRYMLDIIYAKSKEEAVLALQSLNQEVIEPLEQKVDELEEGIRKAKLQRGIALYELVQQHHKSLYYDLILNTPDMFTVTEIAADYGLSAKDLNKILEEEKIQYKKGGRWFLYTKYAKLGLAKAKTYLCTCDKYVHHSVQGLKWTQKGRLFIYDLLKKREILPIGRFHNKIQHWNLEVNRPVYTPARLAASIAWSSAGEAR